MIYIVARKTLIFNAMKKLLLTIAVLFAGISFTSAQSKDFIDQNYIEITGRAEMEVAPDEIYLNITINEKDNKGKISVEQQEKDMFRRLTAIGIDIEKDLTVQDMASDLKTYLLKKNAVMTTKSFQLKINSTEMLSKVFQTLGEAGIADVSIAKTAISNIQELRKEARIQAAKAAQENAASLAEAVGRKLGKALYIQDSGYTPRYYTSNIALAKSTVMADGAVEEAMPSLEFEKIRIEMSVLIRFALE